MDELYPDPHFHDIEEMAKLFFPADDMPRLDQNALHKPEIRNSLPGKRNAYGYRADEFSDRGDFNIVYLGCSWVEGLYIPRGELFSDQVSRLLTEKTGKSVRSWNCGLCGTGIDYVARLLPSVMRCLKPDLVVIVVSNLERREVFFEDGRRHWFLGAQPGAIRNGRLKLPQRYWPVIDALKTITSQNENTANFLRYFGMISCLLEATRTPWIYSSLPMCNKTITRLQDAKAIPQETYLGHAFEHVDSAIPGNAHPGPLSNLRFAEAIAERVLMSGVMTAAQAMPTDTAQNQTRMNLNRGRVISAVSNALSHVRKGPNSGPAEKDDEAAKDDDVYPLW